MAWAFGSLQTDGNSSGTTLACTRPSSIATGDWIVLLIYIETTGLTFSFTNGTWTLVRRDANSGEFEALVYISRYAGEGTTFTLSWGGTSTWRTTQMGRYTGGNTDSAPDSADTDGTAVVDTTIDATVDFTGFTPANDNGLIWYGGTNFAGRSFGALSGTTPTLTERADVGGTAFGDGVQTTATAIGSRTSTLGGGGAHNTGQLFALAIGTGAGGFDPSTVPWVTPAPPQSNPGIVVY